MFRHTTLWHTNTTHTHAQSFFQCGPLFAVGTDLPPFWLHNHTNTGGDRLQEPLPFLPNDTQRFRRKRQHDSPLPLGTPYRPASRTAFFDLPPSRWRPCTGLLFFRSLFLLSFLAVCVGPVAGMRRAVSFALPFPEQTHTHRMAREASASSLSPLLFHLGLGFLPFAGTFFSLPFGGGPGNQPPSRAVAPREDVSLSNLFFPPRPSAAAAVLDCFGGHVSSFSAFYCWRCLLRFTRTPTFAYLVPFFLATNFLPYSASVMARHHQNRWVYWRLDSLC